MENDKLDLSVEELKNNAGGNKKGFVTVLLLSVIIILLLGNIYINFSGKGVRSKQSKGDARADSILGPSEEKEYAMTLEDRELYILAARSWSRYLRSEECRNKHKIMFRIGDCYFKAGMFPDALDMFYRAEKLDTDKELELSVRIQTCLEAMGKYFALKDELAQRTSIDESKKDATVIAVIGSEIISESDLKREIENQVDMQLASIKGKVPVEQFNTQKQEMISSYLKKPMVLKQIAQSRIRTEILYRYALENNVKETPQERILFENMRKNMLGERFIKEEILSKTNITPSDIQTYYRANRDDYYEKPRVKIKILTCGKGKVGSVMEKIHKDNAYFDKLAASDPLNEKLKEWSHKEDTIPGLGKAGEIKRLFDKETKAGDILGPVLVDDICYIIKIQEKEEGRQQPFKEVKEKVAIDYFSRKYGEIERSIIENLKNKYSVSINEEWFTKRESSEHE